MTNRKKHGGHGSPDHGEVEEAGDGQRSHRIGEVVEIRELDKDGNPTGDWIALRETTGGLVVDRPRPDAGVSLIEERPMTETNHDSLTVLVEALVNHTAAIGNLVATLTPELPDFVGTDYIARRLGCSPQWVGRMAESNEIPKDCIVNKTGKGRIWKFQRDKVDKWLADKRQG
jgi:hypothetical protein